MADIQSNIDINIDTSNAVSSIKLLQSQISAFQTAMAKSSAANAATASGMQQNLISNINATRKFEASLQTIKTTTESFTTALEKNKLSLAQYFKYSVASSRSFGSMFSSEFNTINKVARERVKDLQTSYIQMGRDANGALKAIAVRPLVLDMESLATKTQIAAQRQQLLNQLLKQGSTNLLNFGKNTQWAGRQLMVGFTIPLAMAGTAAAKAYMQIEEASIKLRRVYGDLSTTTQETDAMVSSVRKLSEEYAKYGIAVAETMDMAAKAAAMGKTGTDLLAQVNEASRLSALGGVAQEQALETTISLTNAFGLSADKLSSKINFLNAVENQTVTSIEDLTIAIPKAGPVVQQLGGDVEDLAFFLTAMREGGINASEGANALKSGLAALINPTGKASEMLAGFGINVKKIVESNKGDLKSTVVEFAQALDTLDPLNRAKAIEQMFGKFQFARLSTLFKNITAEGTQAQKTAALASMSSIQLAAMSERELKKLESSPMYKFQKTLAEMQSKIAPLGETFLKAVTPVLEGVGKILDNINGMGEGFKQFLVVGTAVIGGLAPVMLMLVGLVANGAANIIKLFANIKSFFNRANTASQILGETTSYMTMEQIKAEAVAASLDQVHSKLTQTFTSEAGALDKLTAALSRQIAAQAGAVPAAGLPGYPRRKMATGGFVPGSGNRDTIPAMLTPGEFVVKKSVASKNMGLLSSLNSGKISLFSEGGPAGIKMPQLVKGFKNATMFLPESMNTKMGAASGRGVATSDITSYVKQAADAGMAPLMATMAQAMGIRLNDPKYKAEFERLGKLFANNASSALEASGREFVKDQDLEDLVVPALKNAAEGISIGGKSVSEALDKTLNEIRTAAAIGTQSGSAGALGRVNLGGSYKGTGGAAKKYALATGNQLFRTETVPSKSRGTKRVFRTYNLDSGQWETATMAHIQKSVNMTVENLKAKIAPYLGDQTSKIMKAISGGTIVGIKKSTDQASPSKEAFDAGKNIGIGAIQGIESTEKLAKPAGQKVSRRATMRAGRYEDGMFYGVGTQATNYSNGALFGPKQNLKGRLKTGYKNVKSGKTKISGAKVSGAGFGASIALGAASMIPGPIGQIAGTLSPIVGIVSMFGGAISKILPLLLRFAGPIGIAATVIGGLITVTNLLSDAKKKELEKTNAASDAASAMAGSLDGLAKGIGVKEKNPLMVAAEAAQNGINNPQQINDVNTLLQSEDFTTAGTDGKKTTKDFIEKLKLIDSKDTVKALLDTTAQGLIARGATDKVVEDTITAIKIAAGKRDIEFNVKSIKLGTAAGDAALNASIGTMVNNIQRKMEKIPFKTVSSGLINSMPIPTDQIDRASSEFQELKSEAEMFGTVFGQTMLNLGQMFASGQMSTEDYNKSVQKLNSSFSNLSVEAKQIALSKMFDGVPEKQKEIASGITSLTDKMKYLQVVSLGGAVSDSIISGLNSSDARVQSRAKIQLANLVEKYKKGAKEIYKATSDIYGDTPDTTGGSRDGTTPLQDLIDQVNQAKLLKTLLNKNLGTGFSDMLAGIDKKDRSKYVNAKGTLTAMGKALKDVYNNKVITDFGVAQTKVLKNFDEEQKTKDALVASGLSYTDAVKAATDADVRAAVVAALSIKDLKERKKRLDEISNLLGKVDSAQKKSNWVKQQDAQKQDIENANAQAVAYKKLVDAGMSVAAAYDTVQDAALAASLAGSATKDELNAYIKSARTIAILAEKLKNPNQRIIDNAQKQIDVYQSQATTYQDALSILQVRENEINETYDKRIDALDKVLEANKAIADQQRGQLDLADALSKGDIASAARAAGEIRAKAAMDAVDSQKRILTEARDTQVKALSIVVGSQTLTMKNLTDKIAALELQISNIKLNTIDPAAEALAKEQYNAIITDKEMSDTAPTYSAPVVSTPAADANTGGQASGSSSTTKTASKTVTVKSGQTLSSIAKANGTTVSKILAANPKFTEQAKFQGGNMLWSGTTVKIPAPVKKASGGMIVPNGFSSGKFASGTDTVPAMLTPGEFVVKKYAVDSFGANNLKAINNGTYDGGSVYNYNVNLNVRSESNADQIARTVIAQIKQVDAQRIRGNRI